MKLTVFTSALIAIVLAAGPDSAAQSVVATRPVQAGVAEPVSGLTPIGYCTAADGPVDLSRLWYLENRSVEAANHRVGLGPQSVGITVLDATPVRTHHHDIPWMVSERGSAGDPDVELKLVVLEGQLAVYWRETYQHRMYRQGLFRVEGSRLVRWCEGMGGTYTSH
jgi:hypothetical protein